MNKVEQLYNLLLKAYEKQGWWPIINSKSLICEYHKSAPNNDNEILEIIIGTILTQNTQFYPNTVKALQQLKLGREFTQKEQDLVKNKKFYRDISNNCIKNNNLIDLDRLSKINNISLAGIIRSAGYYNKKTEKLKIMINFLITEKIENLKKINTTILREKLLEIKGVGPETCDSILLYAFNRPVFVVDLYSKRIFSRLGFISYNDNYDKIQRFFQDSLKKDNKIYSEYHALIVEHAKRYCKKKPNCVPCILRNECKRIFDEK